MIRLSKKCLQSSIKYYFRNKSQESSSLKNRLQEFHLLSPLNKIQSLQSSDFSKQLGLDKQFKSYQKLEQKQQRKLVRSSSLIIILFIGIVGSMILIQFINQNKMKLIIHRFKQIKSKFKFTATNSQQVNSILSVEHQSNLTQIYDKIFKNRTFIDANFINQLQRYINKIISQNHNLRNYHNERNNHNERNDHNIHQEVQEIIFSNKVLYLLDNLINKTQMFQNQTQKKMNQRVLILFQDIVYHFYISRIDKNKTLIKNMSKCLIFYGTLNQQLLAYKMLSQKIEEKSFSKIEKQKIISCLSKNRQQFNQSKKLKKVKKSNSQGQIVDISINKLAYQIVQMQKINEIREKKLKVLQKIFNSL